MFEHQGEGRAVAGLPTQHQQAGTGFGRGPLALAHAHPVAESIDIALLASLGGASLGPGYRLAVDQFNPQPRRCHQSTHLHLFHRQGIGQKLGDAFGVQAQQGLGKGQPEGLHHLVGSHLLAAHHLHLVGAG